MRRLLLAALCASPAIAQEAYSPPLDPSLHPALYLTDVTLAQSALIALQVAGVQTFTVSTNCQVGDRMLIVPGGTVPTGYMLGDIYCSAAGTATAKLFTPALAIGVSYSITAKVIAFR